MRSVYRNLLTLALLATISASGCSKKNPVDEISSAQSGVAVSDAPVDPGDLPSLHWNQWRGGSGDGIADSMNLPTTWGESENVRWKINVPGRGHSSPSVIGDSIYIATAIEDKEQQLVLAYDRGTGEEQWRREVHQGGFPSQSSMHNKSTHANGTVACDGERLYIGFLNEEKIVVSALTLEGDIVWQKEAGKFVSKFGYAPSPTLYKSLVIVAADNMGGGYITAMDSQTGKIAWRIARGNSSSYSSAAVATVGGRDQLVISGGDSVTSYDPATGEQLWQTECIAEATCGTVVTDGEHFFASGGYPNKATVCLSGDGKIVWSNKTKIYEPSMVLLGDQLIGVSDDGIANCWSAKDGEQVWRKRLGGNFSASPIVCNETVYVSDLSGNTNVFQSVDGNFQMIARNRLGNDCYASPAVADGAIFLRIGIGSGRDRKEQLVCIASTQD